MESGAAEPYHHDNDDEEEVLWLGDLALMQARVSIGSVAAAQVSALFLFAQSHVRVSG